MPFNVGPAELVIVVLIAAMIALPIVIIVLLARGAFRTPAGPMAPDPRVVLAERLARREITQDEFDTAMRALGFATPPG